MDLKSGYPYWAVRNGLMQAFPQLRDDWRGDVAIIGGGITGALVAAELAGAGHRTIVVEERDIAWGSTAASTALVQYEIDEHLVDLCGRFGEDDAVLAYRACADGVRRVAALAESIGDVDFAPQRSVYLASVARDVAALEAETALRRRHGFDLRWLRADELEADFGIRAAGAILSTEAARLDPYRLTYRVLARLAAQGTAVFDRTRVTGIQPGDRGVRLQTSAGPVIECSHLVVAAGYSAQAWLPAGLAKNRSSYAFITDPLDRDTLGALAETLVWESARPYLYLRATGDGRLIVGGADDAVDVPARRDACVSSKAAALVEQVAARIPRLRLQPTFAWGGTFAETEDALPWFGPHPQWGPRVHFALAYGGNGITYGAVGATLLHALIERRSHPLADLFGFQRPVTSGRQRSPRNRETRRDSALDGRNG